jgi:dolichyl-phosphate beta-glucosyltransferase
MKNNICIIPFYNEANRINYFSFQSAFTNKSFFFLLVNDGSSDSTLEILTEFAEKYDNVEVVNIKKNCGKGESIRKAVNYSLKNYYASYVGFFDSDFATPFSEYLRLSDIAFKNNFDLVFGARVKLFGSKIFRNQYRHYFSRIIVTIINSIFNLNIYDTQCGCKIYSRNISNVLFKNKFKSKWLFDIELFIRYFKTFDSDSAKEICLNEWKEIPGSKLKAKDFILIPFEIIKLWYFY